MEVGSSSSTQLVQTSKELLGAALAKKQQVADGEAALKLLASASVPVASSSGSVGSNINIKV
ncbi:MAG: hypothetical protein ACJA0N_002815 [Pseudohongiellaceae bacterium]|jgi:hypothetical protein